tara:strand:- start:298 stop:612 length:315 start_codon:yes stop_codon:yes gene_type:complete
VVFQVVWAKSGASEVGYLAGRFPQDQAGFGRQKVYPSAAMLSHQTGVVFRGVLSAERQLESTFAVLVAVAVARVAACFGEDGHDVAAKRDRRLVGCQGGGNESA